MSSKSSSAILPASWLAALALSAPGWASPQLGPREFIAPFNGTAGQVAWVDFDGDGRLDFVSGDTALDVWRQPPMGGYSLALTQPFILVSTITAMDLPMVLEDLDGDGILDLVYRISDAPFGGSIKWSKVGGGTVGVPTTLQFFVPNRDVSIPAFPDVDGIKDLVTTQQTEFGPLMQRLFAGVGGGTFVPRPTIGTSELNSPIAIDYDGDGFEDIAWMDSGGIAIQRSLGNGMVDAPISSPSDGRFTVEILSSDFDGDGDQDILRFRNVASTLTDSPLLIYPNPGTGMTIGTPQPVPNWPTEIVRPIGLGDWDLDGLEDIFVRNTVADSVQVLINRGGLDFAPALTIQPFVPGTFTTKLFDVDEDGDLDLTVGDQIASEYLLYRNLGGFGAVYCTSPPNSTGVGGELSVMGTETVAVDATLLRATSLPSQVTCLFLISPNAGMTPNAGGSEGTLCLGSQIGRFSQPSQIVSSDANGVAMLRLSLQDPNFPGGAGNVSAGETWRFQCWHRDVTTSATSNFTSAVEVNFR